MSNDSFFIICKSNGSTDVYPRNSLSEFTNAFSNDIVLDNNDYFEWKCTLANLHFNAKFGNVPRTIVDPGVSPLILLIRHINRYSIVFQFSIPDGLYSTAEDLVNSMQSQIANAAQILISKRLKSNQIKSNQIKSKLTLTHEESKLALTHEDGKVIFEGAHVGLLFTRAFASWANFDVSLLQKITTNSMLKNVIGESELDVRNNYSFQWFGGGYVQKSNLFAPPPGLEPTLLKVKLHQLKGNPVSNAKYIAMFPYKKDIHKNTIDFESMRNTYFPLDPTRLSKLAITLHDQDSKQLHMLNGQATILKLKFKKMATEQFIIRVASDECSDLFPTNTQSDFLIQLPHSIYLGDRYKVALLSVHYPAAMSPNNYARRNGSLWMEFEDPELTENNIIRVSFDEVHTISLHWLDQVVLKKLWTSSFRINTRSADGAVMFLATRKLHIKVSNLLAFVLGRNHVIKGDYEELSLGGPPSVGARLQKFRYSDGIKEDALFPTGLFLHTDMITAINVGGRLEKVLKYIPIDAEDRNDITKYNSYESMRLDYAALDISTLHRMNFQLKTSAGDQAAFNSDNPVYINLMFKKY